MYFLWRRFIFFLFFFFIYFLKFVSLFGAVAVVVVVADAVVVQQMQAINFAQASLGMATDRQQKKGRKAWGVAWGTGRERAAAGSWSS